MAGRDRPNDIPSFSGTGWYRQAALAVNWLLQRVEAPDAGETPETVITVPAASAVGGHRGVRIDATGALELASPTDANVKPPIGISMGAGNAGDAVTVRVAGIAEESSWAWGTGPVYLGAAGVLTQTLPTTNYLVIMGIAAGPTKMRVDPMIVAAL